MGTDFQSIYNEVLSMLKLLFVSLQAQAAVVFGDFDHFIMVCC